MNTNSGPTKSIDQRVVIEPGYLQPLASVPVFQLDQEFDRCPALLCEPDAELYKWWKAAFGRPFTSYISVRPVIGLSE